MDDPSRPRPPVPPAAFDADDDLERDAAPESEAGARTAAAAAGQAMRALAHVARSFVLYDAANERIRGFLEDVRAKFDRFLATYGEMRLEVRPWDIALGGEIVYSEHDRERSLAFRLYRDGVRHITVSPGLQWEELIVLIGILSIRYKGVRTQEDDVVTLLWRAEFKHIEVGAVEGLVASEDAAVVPAAAAGSTAGPRDALQAMIYDAPYAFDYPWPQWSERAAVERRPVPPAVLARIADEDGTGALPAECLQLARELLAALADRHDPLAPGDAVPVLVELRGFLVGEHCLDALLRVVRMVHEASGLADDVRRDLLRACSSDDVVRRFTLATGPDDAQAAAALEELAGLTPGDHLATLFDLFASHARHRSAPVVRRLLARQLRGRTSEAIERLSALEPSLAIELFQMLSRTDPAGAVDAAAVLLGRAEPGVQLAAARFLDAAEYSGKVGRALVGALGSESPDVRLAATGALVRRRERRAFDPLAARVKARASELADGEAAAAGEAMAALDPDKARTVFKEWVRPSGLLGRLSPGQATLRRAAVAGMALLPGGESEELLQWLARHAGDELGRECEVALTRLRGRQGDPRG